MKEIVLVIPCYGDKEPLIPTLKHIPSDNLNKNGYDLNVLIIATPNQEGNTPNLEELRKTYDKVEMIVERARGYGRAYKTAFNYLLDKSYYLITTGDADGTYPFDKLDELLEKVNLEVNSFINVGRLELYEDGSFSKRNLVGNHLLTWGSRILFLTRLNDSQSGMWMIGSDSLKQIEFDKFGDGMEFSAQIKLYAIKKKSIEYKEIEGPYYPRYNGSPPQLRWFRDAIRIAWKTLLFRFERFN